MSKQQQQQQQQRKAKKAASHAQHLKRGYQGYSIPKYPSSENIVPRIDACNIEPEVFYQQYILQRRPVILQNLDQTSDFCNIVQRWTNSYLKEKAGDKELMIEKRQNIKSNFGRDAPRLPQRFGDFITQLQTGDEQYYLTSQTTNYESDDLPDLLAEPLLSLKDDINISPQLMGNLTPYQINMWMGNTKSGSSSGLHHDYHDNLYVLLRGVKVFNIFTPNDCLNLSLQGKVTKIHPNGLLVYKSAPAIDQNSVAGIDFYHFTFRFHWKLLQWKLIFEDIIKKNNDMKSKLNNQKQQQQKQLQNNNNNNKKNKNQKNKQQQQESQQQQQQFQQTITTLTPQQLDNILINPPLLNITTEYNNINKTNILLFNHETLNITNIANNCIKTQILPRIEYLCEKLLEQRLFLEAEHGFNSDDECDWELEKTTAFNKCENNNDDDNDNNDEDDEDKKFGKFIDSEEEFWNSNEGQDDFDAVLGGDVVADSDDDDDFDTLSDKRKKKGHNKKFKQMLVIEGTVIDPTKSKQNNNKKNKHDDNKLVQLSSTSKTTSNSNTDEQKTKSILKKNDNTTTNNNIKQQDADEDVYPHFSTIPLPLLYAHDPQYPPTLDEITTATQKQQEKKEQEQYKLPISKTLYNTVHETIQIAQDQKTKLGELIQLKQQHQQLQQQLLDANKSTVVLLPGESLYLPASYFHEVRSFNIPIEKLNTILNEKQKSKENKKDNKSNNNDDNDNEELIQTLQKLDQKEYGGHLALNYWFFPPTKPTQNDEIQDPSILFENPYGESLYWYYTWSKTYKKMYKLPMLSHDEKNNIKTTTTATDVVVVNDTDKNNNNNNNNTTTADTSMNDNDNINDTIVSDEDDDDDIETTSSSASTASLTDNPIKIDEQYAGLTAIQRLMLQQKQQQEKQQEQSKTKVVEQKEATPATTKQTNIVGTAQKRKNPPTATPQQTKPKATSSTVSVKTTSTSNTTPTTKQTQQPSSSTNTVAKKAVVLKKKAGATTSKKQ